MVRERRRNQGSTAVSQKKRSFAANVQKANQARPEPWNDRQAAYLKRLEKLSLNLALGPAGTAKTYLATCKACEQLLRGDIRRIAVTRPKAEDEEAWGHLPGDIDKKTAPWARPVMEIVRDCLGGDRYDEARKEGFVAVEPFAYMRGLTLDDCFLILDEAQNATPKQMRLFTTRLGENGRYLINGDIQQKDIRGESGLGVLLRLVEQYDIPCGVTEFGVDHVVRSELCQRFVDAWEQEDAKVDGDRAGLKRVTSR